MKVAQGLWLNGKMRKSNVIGLITAVCFISLFAQAALAEDGNTHWLEFNPYGYTTEFFKEGTATVGSCGAAAVVLVENHLKLGSYIGVNEVKDTNTSMELEKSGTYYIASYSDLINEFNRDGYTPVNRATTNRTTATQRIFDGLARKNWVIIIACHSFNTTNLGHYYPIYGGKLVTTQTGSIDEANSSLSVIEDFNTSYDPNNPNWNVMYQKHGLKKILDSMKSSSSGTYNIIEVSH